jgi:hypothetical protein
MKMLEKVLHHKLLTQGQQGQGVVTERHDQGTESGTSGFHILFEVKGHIKFPDGSESKFQSELLSSGKVGDIQEGAIVPVRYDASNHDHAVLDVVALEAAKDAARQRDMDWAEQRKEEAIAEADAKIAGGNADQPS